MILKCDEITNFSPLTFKAHKTGFKSLKSDESEQWLMRLSDFKLFGLGDKISLMVEKMDVDHTQTPLGCITSLCKR